MLYSMVIFRTSSLGYSISSNPERSGPWRLGVGREVRLYRSLQEGACSSNIKRLLLIKEVQISQIKELSDFICMGRCKISWLTEIIPFVCILAIWGQCPASFHISLSSSVLARSASNSMAIGQQALFFLGVLWAQKFIFGRLEQLMAVTSLFIDMAGNTPFCTWSKL